ncbi:MAG: A/G-specific adenine glycosylase [Burkholderiales bacterium]
MADFAQQIIDWQRQEGRHDLPWQNTREPYRVWLAEIMLQQTQVGTVIPYYRRFLQHFPDITALAAASGDAVMAQWAGLGYYSRARNLHKAAKKIISDHCGKFPKKFDDILALPGIGRSTAAAISAFCFGARTAILDGNVKRVLARYLGVEGYPGDKRIESHLWVEAEALLPPKHVDVYTQGLMDLGATVCTRSQPDCLHCPLRKACVAYRDERTDEMPQRKPKKTIPEKHVVMLIFIKDHRVLLEKRPPTGIWGGLWSLPEVALGEEIGELCSQRFGVTVTPLPRLEVVSHGFTHFTLHITPQPLVVTLARHQSHETGVAWVREEELPAMGLPAPVAKMLKQGKIFARYAELAARARR